jgi:hypothetical protein
MSFLVRFSARILEIVTSSNFTIIKLKYQLGLATINVYMKYKLNRNSLLSVVRGHDVILSRCIIDLFAALSLESI